ncbi:peptidylprolyl isomerase [Reichenbachiella agarivorans]|uniref:Peptidylprolyl isomerase n=1 Tax=Reichenbachiella agarivorans TaxID=2979464 RepID=A0ABY6CKV9_9BACT|nr:peptidylprolyl isomerase [Reichenbachiella agarivorans]UXP31122.1 peptidylprolyl isomerase [Reichenbachiella agarivorans]
MFDYKSILEKEDLNQNDIPFDKAHGRGDIFKYHTYYNQRTLSYIDNHFGEGFAEQLQKQALSNKHWIGPFQPNKGYHIVMLVDRGSGRQPSFDEVKDSAKVDMQGIHMERLKTEAIQDIRDSYEVIIDPEIR